MLGILKIALVIFCIAIIIYIIKNYDYLKQKVKENLIYEGVLLAIYMVVTVVLVSYSIFYIIYALDCFEIIDAEQFFLKTNELINDGVK